MKAGNWDLTELTLAIVVVVIATAAYVGWELLT